QGEALLGPAIKIKRAARLPLGIRIGKFLGNAGRCFGYALERWGRKLRWGSAFREIIDSAIPVAVQFDFFYPAVRVHEADHKQIATAIAVRHLFRNARGAMQRLMNVADKMDQEAQSPGFVLVTGIAGLEHTYFII